METNVDTIIGANVTLKGNLYNKGSIQINGNVEGEIKSDDNIIIGEGARIKGPVVASRIEISGEIKGLVEATEKLEINSTGIVIGDINAKSLIIKEGASFVGKSVMPGGSNETASSKVESKTDTPKETIEMKETKVEKEKEDKEEKDEKKDNLSSAQSSNDVDVLGFFNKK